MVPCSAIPVPLCSGRADVTTRRNHTTPAVAAYIESVGIHPRPLWTKDYDGLRTTLGRNRGWAVLGDHLHAGRLLDFHLDERVHRGGLDLLGRELAERPRIEEAAADHAEPLPLAEEL